VGAGARLRLGQEDVRKAAAGGHLEVLMWAREHGCNWDEFTCAFAAEGGHLEVSQWVREHGCPWEEHIPESDRDCCALAAQGGHLEVLKWLHEHNCPWDEQSVLRPLGMGIWRC